MKKCSKDENEIKKKSQRRISKIIQNIQE